MAIYVAHSLLGPKDEFRYVGPPSVGDFASDAILLDQQQTNGNQSVIRYDVFRSVIGEADPQELPLGTTKILFPDEEFDWGHIPIFDLFRKAVRWVERLEGVLILHHTEQPPRADGTLLRINCTPEELGHVGVRQKLGQSPCQGRIDQANKHTMLVSCLGDALLERLAPLPGEPGRLAAPKPFYGVFNDGSLAKFVA